MGHARLKIFWFPMNNKFKWRDVQRIFNRLYSPVSSSLPACVLCNFPVWMFVWLLHTHCQSFVAPIRLKVKINLRHRQWIRRLVDLFHCFLYSEAHLMLCQSKWKIDGHEWLIRDPYNVLYIPIFKLVDWARIHWDVLNKLATRFVVLT